jgi:hypothetical protein
VLQLKCGIIRRWVGVCGGRIVVDCIIDSAEISELSVYPPLEDGKIVYT